MWLHGFSAGASTVGAPAASSAAKYPSTFSSGKRVRSRNISAPSTAASRAVVARAPQRDPRAPSPPPRRRPPCHAPTGMQIVHARMGGRATIRRVVPATEASAQTPANTKPGTSQSSNATWATRSCRGAPRVRKGKSARTRATAAAPSTGRRSSAVESHRPQTMAPSNAHCRLWDVIVRAPRRSPLGHAAPSTLLNRGG